ncbi:MAG: type II toxin-antitoxin system Phd/YefM family antitoxin [Methylobacter sp.]|jgi:prevent-host-death family protein|nr:type II toxin-antitoxin system Phd/YefM family antitoxin [Methylobacter sp.]MDP1772022.1 type II toxin-antitoxin system Phd/YefM family antitoxin [Methylobacter sp.]
MTTTQVSVAEAKSHISELIAKNQYSHERFIITRRDKPVAALVSLDDLNILEQYEEKQGLAAIAGKWQGFDEVTDAMGDIETLRANGGTGRDVSL